MKDPWGSTTQHTCKKIYKECPHFTADNHFSGNHVLDLAGRMGFGLTLTARRDRLPVGLKQYFHHEKNLAQGSQGKGHEVGEPNCANLPSTTN